MTVRLFLEAILLVARNVIKPKAGNSIYFSPYLFRREFLFECLVFIISKRSESSKRTDEHLLCHSVLFYCHEVLRLLRFRNLSIRDRSLTLQGGSAACSVWTPSTSIWWQAPFNMGYIFKSSPCFGFDAHGPFRKSNWKKVSKVGVYNFLQLFWIAKFELQKTSSFRNTYPKLPWKNLNDLT